MTKEQFFEKYGDIRFLGRFVADCDYYLGYGGRCSKHLWASSVEEQLTYMEWLWEAYKPEWLTKEKLEWYKEQMLQ